MGERAVEVGEALEVSARQASDLIRQQARMLAAARRDVAWEHGQASEHLRRKREAQRVTNEMAGDLLAVRDVVLRWLASEVTEDEALQEIAEVVKA
jgi:hypothetical protein